MAVVDQPSIPQQQSPAKALVPVNAQPALHSDRMMRVDYSAGMEAVQAPHLPDNPGRGLFAGAAALAEGFEHVSNFLTGLAEQVGRAKTITQSDTADIAMQKAHGEFQVWKTKNQNQEEWFPEWQKRLAVLQKDLLSDQSLTPVARQGIEHSLSRFGVETGTGVQVEAAKKTFGDARDTTKILLNDVTKQGDLDKTRRVLEERGTYLNESDHMQAENDTKRAAIAAAVKNRPIEALDIANGVKPESELPEELRGLTEFDKTQMRESSHNEIVTQKTDAFQAMKGAIAKGDPALKDEKSLGKWVKDNGYQWVWDEGDAKAATTLIHGGRSDLETVNGLRNRAKAFNPTGPNADDERADISFNAAKLDNTSEALILGDLKKNMDANDPGPLSLKFGREQIEKMGKDQRLFSRAGVPLVYDQGPYLWGGVGKDGKLVPGALADHTKMAAFGITPTEVDTMKKMEGQAMLTEFQRLVAAHSDNGKQREIQKAAIWSGMSAFTRDLLMRALHEGTFQDQAVKDQNDLRVQELTSDLEKWHAEHMHATSAEVMKWINGQTQHEATAKGARAANPQPAPQAPRDPPNLELPSWRRLEGGF